MEIFIIPIVICHFVAHLEFQMCQLERSLVKCCLPSTERFLPILGTKWLNIALLCKYAGFLKAYYPNKTFTGLQTCKSFIWRAILIASTQEVIQVLRFGQYAIS